MWSVVTEKVASNLSAAIVAAVLASACGGDAEPDEPTPPAPPPGLQSTPTPAPPLEPTATAQAPAQPPTPLPARPAPPPAVQPTAVATPGTLPRVGDYVQGNEHGLARVSTRRVQITERVGWVNVTVGLSIVRLQHDPSLDPPIGVEVGPKSVCLVASVGPDDCVTVVWGTAVGPQVDLTTDLPEGSHLFSLARRMGKEIAVTFEAPDTLDNAGLFFSNHRIELLLQDDQRESPEYDFRLNYPSLPIGDIVFDRERRVVMLERISHDDKSGAMNLEFRATNNAGSGEFQPEITARAGRISDDGTVFLDGVGNWNVQEVITISEPLGPSQSSLLTMTLPRVQGGPFQLWPLETGALPSAMLMELMIEDRSSQAAPAEVPPVYVGFRRSSEERNFWLPDLVVTGIEWEPQVLSVGDDVRIDVTVENQGAFSVGQSTILFRVEGQPPNSAAVGGLGPGETFIASFDWQTTAVSERLVAVIDPVDELEEADETNNETTVDFAGAFKSNLTVDSIRWTPERPSVGDEVVISVVVKNNGPGSSGESVVDYFVDSRAVRFNSDEVPELGLDDTSTQNFIWIAEQGAHTFIAVADARGQIEETDETDNQLAATFPGPALPDLTIEGFAWAPANPSVGDPVSVILTIRNRGGGNSPASLVEYYVDKITSTSPTATATLDPIPDGEAESVTFIWIAESGPHSFRANVDALDQVAEDDDGNNELIEFFSGALLADLFVESITWAPPNPSQNDPVTVSVVVRNRGPGASSPSRVDYFVGGGTSRFGDDLIRRLEAGEAAAETFIWTALPGAFEFRVVADAEGDVEEVDETDNERLAFFGGTLLPDFAIESISWLPEVPQAGESVEINVTIVNRGAGHALGSHITFSFGTGPSGIFERFISSMRPGEKTTESFVWEANGGVHTFTVRVDVREIITEVNEDNNQRQDFLTIE